MATPPTRVSYNVPASGNFASITTPKTTAAFNVQAGDLIVVLCSLESGNTQSVTTPTASGGSVTWTQRARVPAASSSTVSAAWCWTGVVGATATGITVSLARPSTDTTIWWGMSATVWRNHGGVGVALSGSNTTGSGAPSVTATCAANSAVMLQVNDWNAIDGADRDPADGDGWRVINGTPISESTYFRDAARHTVYGGYHLDTGAAGSVTVGLSQPATMRWALAGVEILGTAGGGGSYTGTLSASAPRATSSIAGTATAPTASGTLSSALPRVTASISGTATAPTYTGSVSSSVPAASGSLAGTVTTPSASGTVAASTPVATSATAGTVTPPTYNGTTTAALPATTGSMSGTATPPTYTGTLTAPIPPTRSTITGTVTTPAGAATLSATTPRVTASMTGTVAAPIWTATLAAQVARATSTMLGTVTGPAFTGSLGGTLPTATGNLTGTVTTPTGSGTLAATLPRVTTGLVGVVQVGNEVDVELVVGTMQPARYSAATALPAPTATADAPRVAAGTPLPPRYTRRT